MSSAQERPSGLGRGVWDGKAGMCNEEKGFQILLMIMVSRYSCRASCPTLTVSGDGVALEDGARGSLQHRDLRSHRHAAVFAVAWGFTVHCTA